MSLREGEFKIKCNGELHSHKIIKQVELLTNCPVKIGTNRPLTSNNSWLYVSEGYICRRYGYLVNGDDFIFDEYLEDVEIVTLKDLIKANNNE